MKKYLFLCLILWSSEMPAQVRSDSLPAFARFRKAYQEKAYKLLVGINLQGNAQVEDSPTLKYLELGLHRTFTEFGGQHPPVAYTYGLSTEILVGQKPIYGFKASAWATAWLFVAGLSAVYYTDFDAGNFKIRPEIGIGFHYFKLTMGYNIPTFYNKDFDRIRRQNIQITLNVLIKLKTIERK